MSERRSLGLLLLSTALTTGCHVPQQESKQPEANLYNNTPYLMGSSHAFVMEKQYEYQSKLAREVLTVTSNKPGDVRLHDGQSDAMISNNGSKLVVNLPVFRMVAVCTVSENEKSFVVSYKNGNKEVFHEPDIAPGIVDRDMSAAFLSTRPGNMEGPTGQQPTDAITRDVRAAEEACRKVVEAHSGNLSGLIAFRQYNPPRSHLDFGPTQHPLHRLP